MCLKLGRCGREKGPRTESERGRDHLVCIDDEETGGFARKVGRPRETTARVILKGGFFCFTNGWDSQRSQSCACGGRGDAQRKGLASTATHRVVHNQQHQCLGSCQKWRVLGSPETESLEIPSLPPAVILMHTKV